MKEKEFPEFMRIIKILFFMSIGLWLMGLFLLDSVDIKNASINFMIVAFLEMLGIALMIIIDIQKKQKTIEQLTAFSITDQITGASNWTQFQKNCKNLFMQNPSTHYAMVTLDIDKFKAINDLLSHEIGNDILIAIAKSLANMIDDNETFSRAAGDNFNLLVVYENQMVLEKRMLKLLNEIKNYTNYFRINISIGIYVIYDNSLDINLLNDRATMAKNSIKNNSEKPYAFYTEAMRQIMLKEKEFENRMVAALINNEFEMYLQPKYLFSDEKIIGAEALVRWNCPGQGIIPPNDFIPLFERNSFVKKIDNYMFEEACKFLHKWNQTNVENIPMTISVNFSRVHLNNLDLAKELITMAKDYCIDPKCIEIELTETMVFDDSNQMVAIMNELKNAGFQISIDDFGKAYSSLNTLKDLPADILKLDKEFFEETVNNSRGKKIVNNILKMAKDLEITTVAEGVETKEQVEFLKEMGCDIAQGYYYARPMRVNDFEIFVRQAS
jgi:diguanylate cyclase (GGDEF)-like protein